MKCISLCSGYEGIGLGLKRILPDMEVIAYSEIEAYACLNLIDKMEQGLLDPAPIWTDLKSFPNPKVLAKEVNTGDTLSVDIITGGFPC